MALITGKGIAQYFDLPFRIGFRILHKMSVNNDLTCKIKCACFACYGNLNMNTFSNKMQLSTVPKTLKRIYFFVNINEFNNHSAFHFL